jgi:hypothetical protein
MSALSEKIRKARTLRIEAGKHVFLVLRPTPLEYAEKLSGNRLRGFIDLVIGWENVIGSDWYMARLRRYQAVQIRHLGNGLSHIRESGFDLREREESIAKELDFMGTDSYVDGLVGTVGL